jgi:hypothetical protein
VRQRRLRQYAGAQRKREGRGITPYRKQHRLWSNFRLGPLTGPILVTAESGERLTIC